MLFEKKVRCAKCGKRVSHWATTCPRCGGDVVDKINLGYCLLAFLFPLFGWIYWGVKHNKAPKKAKACGIASIIGVIFNIVIEILMYGI